jgi:hypothetical protein
MSDSQIAARTAEITGLPIDQVATDLGIKRDRPGMGTAFQGSIGDQVSGFGRMVEENVAPGVGRAIRNTGEDLSFRNPRAVTNFEEFGQNPGLGMREFIGQAGASILPMIGTGVVGAGLRGMTAGAAGMAGRTTNAVGRGMASMPGVVAAGAVPGFGAEYGNVRAIQDDTGQESIPAAFGAAAANTAIEFLGGPQAVLARRMGLSGGGFQGLGRTPMRTFGKEVLKQSGQEAAEEMVQNPISQYAGGQDPTNPEQMGETAFGMFGAALGVSPFGAARGIGRASYQRGLQNQVDQNLHNPSAPLDDRFAAADIQRQFNERDMGVGGARQWYDSMSEGIIQDRDAYQAQQLEQMRTRAAEIAASQSVSLINGNPPPSAPARPPRPEPVDERAARSFGLRAPSTNIGGAMRQTYILPTNNEDNPDLDLYPAEPAPYDPKAAAKAPVAAQQQALAPAVVQQPAAAPVVQTQATVPDTVVPPAEQTTQVSQPTEAAPAQTTQTPADPASFATQYRKIHDELKVETQLNWDLQKELRKAKTPEEAVGVLRSRLKGDRAKGGYRAALETLFERTTGKSYADTIVDETVDTNIKVAAGIKPNEAGVSAYDGDDGITAYEEEEDPTMAAAARNLGQGAVAEPTANAHPNNEVVRQAVVERITTKSNSTEAEFQRQMYEKSKIGGGELSFNQLVDYYKKSGAGLGKQTIHAKVHEFHEMVQTEKARLIKAGKAKLEDFVDQEVAGQGKAAHLKSLSKAESVAIKTDQTASAGEKGNAGVGDLKSASASAVKDDKDGAKQNKLVKDLTGKDADTRKPHVVFDAVRKEYSQRMEWADLSVEQREEWRATFTQFKGEKTETIKLKQLMQRFNNAKARLTAASPQINITSLSVVDNPMDSPAFAGVIADMLVEGTLPLLNKRNFGGVLVAESETDGWEAITYLKDGKYYIAFRAEFWNNQADSNPDVVQSVIAHELQHVLDDVHNEMSPNRYSRGSVFNKGGPIETEVQAAMQESPEIAAYFDYPLGKNFSFLDANERRVELFAQVMSAYNTPGYRELMGAFLPNTFTFAEITHAKQQTDARASGRDAQATGSRLGQTSTAPAKAGLRNDAPNARTQDAAAAKAPVIQVSIQAFEEGTGRPVKIKLPADEAMASLKADIQKAKELLQCLTS